VTATGWSPGGEDPQADKNSAANRPRAPRHADVGREPIEAPVPCRAVTYRSTATTQTSVYQSMMGRPIMTALNARVVAPDQAEGSA